MDAEKWSKTQMESTLDYRHRFDVDQRRKSDVEKSSIHRQNNVVHRRLADVDKRSKMEKESTLDYRREINVAKRR